jgi:steroid delta-isomerase-like uncharacterized protein
MRLFNDGVNKRDLSVFTELYCPDSSYHFPFAGELSGGEGVRHFFEHLLSAFPDLERTIEDQMTDDFHSVTVRWSATGTHKGPFLGIAPTGNRITVTGISIYHIAGGKIVGEWQEWSELKLMQQLGVVSRFDVQRLLP